jgi:hypothetical protein
MKLALILLWEGAALGLMFVGAYGFLVLVLLQTGG